MDVTAAVVAEVPTFETVTDRLAAPPMVQDPVERATVRSGPVTETVLNAELLSELTSEEFETDA